ERPSPLPFAHASGVGPQPPAEPSTPARPLVPVNTGTLSLSGEEELVAVLKPSVPFHDGAQTPVGGHPQALPQVEGHPQTLPQVGGYQGGFVSEPPRPTAWAPLAAPPPPPPPLIVAPQPALLMGGVLEASNAALRAGAARPLAAGAPGDAPISNEAAGQV